MFDASAVKALADPAASRLKLLDPIPGDDVRRRVVLMPDGQANVLHLEPGPQEATAGTIAAVAKAADREDASCGHGLTAPNCQVRARLRRAGRARQRRPPGTDRIHARLQRRVSGHEPGEQRRRRDLHA